jgi:membrane protein implicated in regulation of membrane protease activity
VRFINAIDEKGRSRVFRNEDTGWGWPPYFKIDSSNLQAEAQNLVSTEASPRWVVLTYYGWRSQLLTIFPNAVAVREVASPDVRIIPWLNIVILTVLAGMLLLLWRMWAQFRERTIDPALERAGDAFEAVDDRADEVRGRLSRWLDSWRGKTPPRR